VGSGVRRSLLRCTAVWLAAWLDDVELSFSNEVIKMSRPKWGSSVCKFLNTDERIAYHTKVSELVVLFS
jgi:hypothetical protein